MIQMTVQAVAQSVPFELTVEYDGGMNAPVAALGQLNGWDGTYKGNPLQLCAEAVEEMAQELRNWKPSQTPIIPHHGTIAWFALKGGHDWFQKDIGTFRVQAWLWFSQRGIALRKCIEAPTPHDVETAKEFLQHWSQIISDIRNAT